MKTQTGAGDYMGNISTMETTSGWTAYPSNSNNTVAPMKA
jgi:hypothetical protein